MPRTAPVCTACGLAGGGHAPDCQNLGIVLLGLADRLDEITGIGAVNARVLIAELGTDPSTFPAPGHAAAWARLTSRTMQSGDRSWNGRAGKGNPHLRGALGQAVMSAAKTDTRLGAMYRRIARKRGKQKAIVAVVPRHLRDRLDPHLRPRRPLHRTRTRLLPAPQRPPENPGQHPADRKRQPRQEGRPRR